MIGRRVFLAAIFGSPFAAKATAAPRFAQGGIVRGGIALVGEAPCESMLLPSQAAALSGIAQRVAFTHSGAAKLRAFGSAIEPLGAVGIATAADCDEQDWL